MMLSAVQPLLSCSCITYKGQWGSLVQVEVSRSYHGISVFMTGIGVKKVVKEEIIQLELVAYLQE